MRTWRGLVIAVMVVLAFGFFYRWWRTASERAERRPHATQEPEEPEPAVTLDPRPPAAALRRNGLPPPEPPPGPKLDRAQADRMRAELHALFAEAGPLALMGGSSAEPIPPPAGSFPSMPVLGTWDGGDPRVDPSYIQKRVREDLFPLARNCYADALKRNPKAAGRLSVSFRIIGDRKVGGVVDDAKMTEDTTLDDAEMQTCVRESMMSVSFDAPPGDRNHRRLPHRVLPRGRRRGTRAVTFTA